MKPLDRHDHALRSLDWDQGEAELIRDFRIAIDCGCSQCVPGQDKDCPAREILDPRD